VKSGADLASGMPNPAPPARPLVRVDKLAKFFPVRRGLFGKLAFLRAVDGVSLDIARGETLGLVGESGCGKSTPGAHAPAFDRSRRTAASSTNGREIVPLGPEDLRALRRKMQIIFSGSVFLRSTRK